MLYERRFFCFIITKKVNQLSKNLSSFFAAGVICYHNIIRRVKNLSSGKIKISVSCKVITFSNLFLHCCGEAGHGMISLDYGLNFQAGVVIVHVSEYKLHESIYR